MIKATFRTSQSAGFSIEALPIHLDIENQGYYSKDALKAFWTAR